MNMSLTPELEKFVTEKVESGKYNSVEEVVTEGLRLLKEHDDRKQDGTNDRRKEAQARLASVSAEKEWQWLAEHQEQYRGQWVALSGDQLIAYGESAREVYLAARRAGVEIPAVIHIPSEPELPFGEW